MKLFNLIGIIKAEINFKGCFICSSFFIHSIEMHIGNGNKNNDNQNLYYENFMSTKCQKHNLNSQQ